MKESNTNKSRTELCKKYEFDEKLLEGFEYEILDDTKNIMPSDKVFILEIEGIGKVSFRSETRWKSYNRVYEAIQYVEAKYLGYCYETTNDEEKSLILKLFNSVSKEASKVLEERPVQSDVICPRCKSPMVRYEYAESLFRLKCTGLHCNVKATEICEFCGETKDVTPDYESVQGDTLILPLCKTCRKEHRKICQNCGMVHPNKPCYNVI